MARIEVPERLADARIRLRLLAESDAPAYTAAFHEDRDLGRLLGLQANPDEAWARAHALRCREAAEDGACVELAIRDIASDYFLGVLMLLLLDWPNRRCELGYWLTPQARRKGIASAAVSVALDWVFVGLELLRVEIATTTENVRSQALARRHGFTEEALQRARDVERDRRVDVIQFGLLREEHLTVGT